jgi:DNA polymerase-3 subunit delta'
MTDIAFLPAPEDAAPEVDRIAGIPHPREMLSLVGHAAAETEFLALYNSGRLHHAFLLTGPEGIGKASFAYRVARFLFAEPEREGGFFGAEVPETLAVSAESRAAHLVANNAHPDIAVLKRRYDPDTKRFRAEIGVAEMRDALTLLEKTPAFGGWRIVIVDAADDLNASSANALLKTLEEPPAKTLFLLVAHQPQKLLPTIRSRCRKLAFEPLAASDLGPLIAALTGNAPDGRALVAAEGSVRQALRLGDPGLRAFLGAVREVLDALPERRHGEMDRIAATFRSGAAGAQPMADFLAALEGWLHDAVMSHASAGRREGAGDLAEFWSRMQADALEVEAYNLDRRAFALTRIEELATLVSGARR